MILTKEESQIFLNEANAYTGNLIKKRWSYHILKDNTSPIGNIIAFESPIQLGLLELTKALVLAIEIPNCNVFGSICFTRLYCAQLGSLLTEFFDLECFVDGNCHILNNKQCSLSFTSVVSEAALINIIISLCPNNQDILVPVDVGDDFKQKAIDSFHFLTRSIFIETQRDNF